MQHFDFSLIIPTLNEGDTIGPLIAAVGDACRARGLAPEILVADGGSNDGTVEVVEAYAAEPGVRLVRAQTRRGLAGDVLTAAAVASCEVVAVMDADFSHPPESLPDLVEPLLAGDCDMSVGSRYCAGGRISDWPWTRRVLSRLGTWAALPLVSVNDPLSGFFAVRREHLLRLGGQVHGFKLALEVLARSGDALRVHEIPIRFQDRRAGHSKLGLRESLRTFEQVAALAGSSASPSNVWRFVLVGFVGLGVDLAVFRGLVEIGWAVHAAYVTAFLVATFGNYLLNSRWSFQNLPQRGWRAELPIYGRYVTSCVFALILRVMVFSALLDGAGWSIMFAGLAGIATGALVNYVGAALFVFPQPGQRATPALRWRSLALAFLAYSIALRLFGGLGIDLIPEEAYYWNYAQHLAPGYLDHPPMIAWLIAGGTALFGNSELGVRIGAMLCWFVGAGFVFALTLRMYGRVAAIFALMLAATLPGFFGLGMLATPDAPLFAAWAGALYFFYRALAEGEARAWYGAGIALGLGLLSKYTIALLGPAALVFMLVDGPSRKWLARPQPYLAALLVMALFTPVIYWNAIHDWVSFWFQGGRRWDGIADPAVGILLAQVMAVLTPMMAAAALMMLWPAGQMDRRWRFAVCFTAVPLAVFVLYSLQNEPKLNWTIPLWLAALPWLGVAIGGADFRRFRWVGAGAWRIAGAASLLLWGGVLSVSATAWVPDRDLSLPAAWEELAASIDAAKESYERDGHVGIRVVGTDKYFISSEFAFYDPCGQGPLHASGRHLLGRDSLMWAWWSPGQTAVGRDLLLVAFDRAQLSESDTAAYFTELGPIRSGAVTKHGRTVARYFYRLGHGYRYPVTASAVHPLPPRGQELLEGAAHGGGVIRSPCAARTA